MASYSRLKSTYRYNVETLRRNALAELSGSLGDLGTLLPLMIAMSLAGSIDLVSTLVFSGLTNIFTGLVFGIPLPVQPMKAIAAVAISQRFSKDETAAAGLTMGVAVFVLSTTGLLGWLHRVVPTSVVRGIQVAAGLSLAISAGTSLLQPLHWTHPAWDNHIWTIFAFLLLVTTALVPKTPYALITAALGLIISIIVLHQTSHHTSRFSFWHPVLHHPSLRDFRVGAIQAAIPQLPLTTLNSIIAVPTLAASLLPSHPLQLPSTTALGLSVAVANLIACPFGAMPICHGSGGLAAQVRFGARSGASVIVLGVVKVVLGLVVGEALVPVLKAFPGSLLGVMVVAAGVELAKVAKGVASAVKEREGGVGGGIGREEESREVDEQWTVMLVTVAGCLAFKNDAVGFVAGLIWYWALRLPNTGRRLRWWQQGGGEEGESLIPREDVL